MPEKKKKKPDFSEVALRVVKEATDDTKLTKPPYKASPKKPG